MEKYFYLDKEQDRGGASFDDTYSTFHSSLLLDFPSLTDHKPLQTSTSLISHPFPMLTTPESSETGFMADHISNQPSVFQLPNLRSLEENLDTEFKLHTESPYQLNSPLSAAATYVMKYKRQRDLARQRRQRVRDRIESLKELLPTHNNKKMDTATVLENAGNYIRFLEAQVNVLEAMPVDDCLVTENVSLNRNRVLQIMVNSNVTQGKMSSEGMCVYSVEQLVQIIGRLFTSEEASFLLNSILFSSFAPH